jgi:beta-lactamase class A
MYRALAFLLGAAAALAQTPPAEVWAVPSVYKVRPDAPAQARNLVWDKASKTITVAGAKNEHVPFQVVVSVPPSGRHAAPASGFFVEAGDLRSETGRIPRENVKLYFEHFILCYGKSSPVGDTGFWPDALAPLTDPFDMAIAFRQTTRNRPIWVDIVAPPDIPAGVYSGAIRVTQNGKPVDELKLRLTVYGFALPSETHLVTYMGVSSEGLAAAHHLPPSSPEVKAMLRKYHTFLYANRMQSWFNEPLQPQIEVSGDSVVLTFDREAYDLYMNQWHTKRVILEAAPSDALAGAPEFSPDAGRRVRSYLSQTVDFYRKNGWLDRLVFNSPIDEPNSARQFEDTRKWAALVHAAAPGVPFLATKTPVPQNPNWGTLRGYVNNFSVHGNDLNGPEARQAIREEQAKGGEITWYISCDQGYPQPNYFIDAPAMDPVMVPWITWRYRMQGILYWDMKFWSQTPDPWLSPVTYLSGFLCSDGYVLNGEGSLLYPGSRVKQYTGQRDVDGPVSSIRFELLREGIEDYEYLWLLKSLGDPQLADDAARNMVVDVRAFSRNAEDLFALREKLARRIEELTAGSHPAARTRREAMDRQVRSAISGFQGSVKLYAKNLDTGETYGIGENDKVRTASTIKLPVMVAVFRAVADGRAKWDEPLTLREEDRVTGSGVLREFSGGLQLPLRDVLRMMIVVSDNTAANMVIDRIGADAVNAEMDRYGLPATRLMRKIRGDGQALKDPSGFSAAGKRPENQRFGLGSTTPKEMVTLLEKLERGEIVSPAASREMIAILKRQQFKDGIGRRLEDDWVASKSGALDALRSDVGLVYTPKARVAMAITVDDMPKVDYSPDNPGNILIGSLARMLLEGLGALDRSAS